ncbi:MAG: 30S ribosomal protein S13 [Candidatus Wolfebacteria bacterium]|nr:30S ribosomal protein S13 [Candidatus Wolfebacteria bacterium]MDP2704214.1 30S ribosomal protein S13 [bacterium]
MRISGVNIPDEKKIKIALTYIYGIGHTSAGNILRATKIDAEKRAKNLEREEVNRIQVLLEKDYKVEGELRQIKRANINRLKSIKTYRGIRHTKGLPVRGQRTKSNSRTVRGNVRKTAGSGKRKVELK